ncbi:MAG TPA: LuxR C-terminal-related transcriptional regulator, partial [Pseudonocardia sp.]|nr:LuxR C-terminal-related transcriptional regulator [Pseudonocardia sp.]
RARQVQPGLVVDEDVVRAICELADGLPLAIELAAAHARALQVAEIQSGMADRLGFLTGLPSVGEPRHRSLEASIGWSYQLLDPSARGALRALSVFPGRFTLDAAVAVIGRRGRELVELLVDHSLVLFSPVDGRYRLLDTIREFAARENNSAGEAEATGRRVLDWVVALTSEAVPGLERADPAVLGRLVRDDVAIRAALGYAIRTGDGVDVAAEVVTGLAFYWSVRGQLAEGWEWARRVSIVSEYPSSGLTWASGFLAGYAGDLAEAAELARRAVTLAEATGDDRMRGRALITLGMVATFDNQASNQATVIEAIEYTDRAGDRWGSVESRQLLAYLYLAQSDYRRALIHLDTSLPIAEELGHDQLLAWDAGGRADAARLAGQFEVAVIAGRRALELACPMGDPVSAAFALRPLVQALCQLGRSEEAAAEVTARRSFFAEHPGVGSGELVAHADAIAAMWATGAASVRERLEQLQMDVPSGEWGVLAAEVGAMRAVSRLAGGDAEAARVVAGAAVEVARQYVVREAVCVATLAGCSADRLLGGATTDAASDTDARAHQALADAAGLGLWPQVADALDVVAGLAIDKDRLAVAARLHGASARLRGELGCVLSPLAALFRPADEAEVARRLPAQERATACREGGRLDAPRAVTYAARARGRRSRPQSGWASLTPTELEVVTLTTAGLGNRAIAEQLLIGEGTVRTHLRHVFAKLAVRTRAELAAAAARRGI